MKKKHVSSYLSEKEYNFLRKVSDKEELSISEYIRNIIRELISEDNLRKQLREANERSDYFLDDMG